MIERRCEGIENEEGKNEKGRGPVEVGEEDVSLDRCDEGVEANEAVCIIEGDVDEVRAKLAADEFDFLNGAICVHLVLLWVDRRNKNKC